MWNTNYVDETGVVKDINDQGKLRPGLEVLEMMRRNLTVRLFDPLARHEMAEMKRSGKEEAARDKLELREEYTHPKILGQDLFDECGILTDYQWSLISGPNTGTGIHLDPPFANSWNTLF